jgi:hypothetical protein
LLSTDNFILSRACGYEGPYVTIVVQAYHVAILCDQTTKVFLINICHRGLRTDIKLYKTTGFQEYADLMFDLLDSGSLQSSKCLPTLLRQQLTEYSVRTQKVRV